MLFMALAIAAFGYSNSSFAQDTVFLNTGRPIRGKISVSTPDQIQVGDKTIPIQDVKKISFSGAPRELGRAKASMETGQYNDAWDQLQKITETPTGMILQEYQYVEAFVMGKLALQGGSVSVQKAGGQIGSFLQRNPTSFRVYPLTELYGQLLVSINKIELAEAEFQKLSNSACELNDVNAQQYKTMAKCQSAKALALQGQVEEAQAIIEKIIKDENPDDKRLFAYCYNALGVCHMKSKKPIEAELAFLHTDLLFSTEPDAHAEALFHLYRLWSDRQLTDRANRAREVLSSNYANSFWKLKLDNGG